MRVAILTSCHIRHLYFIKRISECFDVAGVWQEERAFNPDSHASTTDDLEVIRAHFKDRDESEIRYFEAKCRNINLNQSIIHQVPKNTFRDDLQVGNHIYEVKPELILVFGTSVIRAEIIKRLQVFPIINMHLGISPYYRGSGTNFWPLVDEKPELVGATIHFLDSSIDAGPIIAHARPEIAINDGVHDIGNKAIMSGMETLLSAARHLSCGKMGATVQKREGKLMLRKDFNAQAVRRLNQNFKNGMIEKYLRDKTKRDSALQLINLQFT